VEYKSINSCLLPINDVNGKHVVTIEGLNQDTLSLVQSSFVEEGASQCGFCTPGFIISLTGYLISQKKYDENDAVYSMDGNICRCTGHSSIIRAAKISLEKIHSQKVSSKNHIMKLIGAGVLPEYFIGIRAKLDKLKKDIKVSRKRNKPVKYLISGGTDLYVRKWEDIYETKANFLSSEVIPSSIKQKDKNCIIGAGASVSDLIKSTVFNNYFPEMKKQLLLFGSLPIRNRATVGGNIVNASPIADITSILLALDAKLRIKSGKSFRQVELKKFYKEYKKLNLKKSECLYDLSFKLPTGKFYFNFEKVSQRTYLDIASVNSSIFIETNSNIIEKVNLSAGGVAPVPRYLKEVCKFLKNKEISEATIFEATKIADSEISPISDVRGSSEYKRLLMRQLIFTHFIKLFPARINIGMIA
ncbi:MAG: (2Fe-2S)-binding protein, partial [Ignavibacteriaceae bacterium]|nr:(2Fe-2S)-binding protein [Ignavibacteriaceae bacterium]